MGASSNAAAKPGSKSGSTAGKATPAATPAQPGGKAGGSIFDRAAQGLSGAGTATADATQGYASIADSLTGGLGQAGSAGYTAARQANPAAIKSGIASYMNPYTSDVINRTSADIRRQTQLGLRDIGDTAAGAGAFGGSRMGIAEGVAAGEGSKALGDVASQLRSAGFDKAAELSGQDIANRMTAAGANQAAINAARQYSAGARSTGAQQAISNRLAALAGQQSAAGQGATLADQALRIGQGLSGQQSTYGGQVQDISKQLIGQSAGMFDQYTGQPLESTAAILNLLSGNPLSGTGTTTQTNTPGLKSQLGSALGLVGRVAPV